MSPGRCVFCGELIKIITTIDGKEVSHCMHIREISLSPSQFDQAQTFSGLWACHKCYSSFLYNIAANAKDYNNGGF